jgi:hypothetical protein
MLDMVEVLVDKLHLVDLLHLVLEMELELLGEKMVKDVALDAVKTEEIQTRRNIFNSFSQSYFRI